MKECTKCHATLSLADFHRDAKRRDGLCAWCKRCAIANASQWARRNPEKCQARNMRHKYGITPEWYDATLRKQGGGCAICGTTKPGGAGRFQVDHDHACCPGVRSCGKCLRGLLCWHCNRGLGSFSDNPERLQAAVAYLVNAATHTRESAA